MVGLNGDFLHIIGQFSPTPILLPAVHTTNVSFFYKIAQTRALQLSACLVFKKDLVYFFYGKPVYQVKPIVPGASKILGEAAVCLCLRLDSFAQHIDKIHAFDTGACHDARYNQLLPPGTDFDDFELPKDHESPSRYANAFFGSNRDYYDGNLKTNLAIRPMDVVSDAIKNLLSTAKSANFDERVATVEIQVNQDIALSPGVVTAVVAPSRFKADQGFLDACQFWQVDPIYYRFKRAIPEARTEVVYEKLGDHYERQGYFA